MKKYILSLDQGTTSSRTVLFDEKGMICGISQKETRQIYPKHGWVEQNPIEIYQTQLQTLKNVVKENKINAADIVAMGISNQRETTVVWNKTTGKPIYNAIVWQDLRTSTYCKELKEKGFEKYIHENTGLRIDSYFSATKIKWILENVPKAKAQAQKGMLLFGTIDTWLLWNLTNGKVHATDYSNASRTLLFNIKTLEWDQKLLDIFEIPRSMLPKVKASSDDFGAFDFQNYKLPITGIAGDQQAALFGQACFEKGDVKSTYGTGCFLLMNTGEKPHYSKHGLLSTIAWGLNGKIYYALEGSVFMAGAAVQWLRDALKIVKTAKETELIAKKIKDDYSVFVVPALSGLGAPYWDTDARGAIFGLSQNTGKDHLIKATLEAIAYQCKDLIIAMQHDAKVTLNSLKVDGGASANNYLMQFQADILNTIIERAKTIESTALGAAYLAGIGIGLWTMDDIVKIRNTEKKFMPEMDTNKSDQLYAKWEKAVQRTRDWED
ncbi:MAG: glycerol kinase GlpK [Flavobacteriaceae bacterium]|nr:glycerol kinase GlpK [Flavobacteriaceae bacterium]